MAWVERQTDTGMAVNVTLEKAEKLTQAREEGLPVVQREAANGQLPLDPIRFTPVKSIGFYEGEFAKKDGDLLFHFWPWGFHQAQRDEKVPPRFNQEFEHHLRTAMCSMFGTKGIRFDNDKDMGSWAVTIPHWGEKQFFHDLAVKACEKLHYALGGQ